VGKDKLRATPDKTGDGSSRRSCVPIVALAKLGRAMADTSIRALCAHSQPTPLRGFGGQAPRAGLSGLFYSIDNFCSLAAAFAAAILW